MNSDGHLSEVPMGEQLVRLGESGLTGTLKVKAQSPGGKVEALRVVFTEGLIVQVDSPTRAVEWRLGQLAVRGGLVGEGDIEAALERAQLRGRPIGSVLVAKKQLSEAQLEELLHVQFLEDLTRSLSWREGAWRVKARQTPPRHTQPAAIDPVEAAQRGLKTLEKWSTIRSLVPSNEAAFSKVHTGPIPEDEARQKKLGAQELRVFSLIHHSRTVFDLVALARLSSYEVCRSLALLAHGGYVALHEAGEVEVLGRPQESAGRKIKRAAAFHGFTALLVAACLAVSVGVFLSVRAKTGAEITPETSEVVVAAAIDPLREAQTQGQLERLRVALEIYREVRGDYPPRLEVLVETHLVKDGDLTFPDYERTYTYRPQGEGYMLSRPKK